MSAGKGSNSEVSLCRETAHTSTDREFHERHDARPARPHGVSGLNAGRVQAQSGGGGALSVLEAQRRSSSPLVRDKYPHRLGQLADRSFMITRFVLPFPFIP